MSSTIEYTDNLEDQSSDRGIMAQLKNSLIREREREREYQVTVTPLLKKESIKIPR